MEALWGGRRGDLLAGRWEDRTGGRKVDRWEDRTGGQRVGRWEDRTEGQRVGRWEDRTGGQRVGRWEDLTGGPRVGRQGARREDPPPVGWGVKGSTGPTAGQPKVQVRPQVRVARPSRAPATGPMQEALQRPGGWAVKMEARGPGRATGQQPVRAQPLMQGRKRVPYSSTAVFEACPQRRWSRRCRAAPWWHRPQRFRRRRPS